MMKSEHMTGRVLLVPCNLAASADGRAAMLNGSAGRVFVEYAELWQAAVQRVGKGGAEETLEKVEKTGSKRAKKKASRILELLRGKEEEDEDEIDWDKLLELKDDMSRRVKLG
ncbi:U-box domain-containing protein 40 [Abeliophyllum distichum]|uniref:U-box domain-containing protein 40 n=1 Tax=Abeliophyllum distichum TaxID=126358 RepID=A0ABD1R9R6_9LAMI